MVLVYSILFAEEEELDLLGLCAEELDLVGGDRLVLEVLYLLIL